MKKLALVSLMALISATGMAQPKSDNPFFKEYNTPFKVPPFNLIDTSHYIPAFEKGIMEQQAEIDAIVKNPKAPTFENTILPFDQSGALLEKVGSVFYSLNGANTSPALQAIARKISPVTTKHQDNISLNEKLFQRIKTVYEKRNKSKLTPLQIRVVEKYYDGFVRNGANLSEADKGKLRAINQELSMLGIKFGENLLSETNKNFKLVIDNQADLAGLPADLITAASDQAKQDGMEGKWVFTLQKPSMIPFLQYAQNRELRKKIYMGYNMRGNNNNEFDNKETILKIANLRAERANILGFKTYAEYIIDNNMAKTPENVYQFLNKIMEPALAVAKKDLAEMQAIADREGLTAKLEAWDWWYYSEKLRKEKYNLDEAEIKPYLSLEGVRYGMFYVATKLYGVTFTKRPDFPTYHAEVDAFEVKDSTGKHVGVLYLDYHPRPGKRVGAWCGRFRDQGYENGNKITPVVTIVTNFTRPAGDVPALLTWDETTTLFHEFGHALHGLFTDGQYQRIAGIIPRDMVELPSQIMENWAGEPEVLKVYAKHYKTGEVMPQELINKLEKSMTFNQAFVTVEYIAASILDLDWHSFTAPKQVDVNAFEKESMDKIHLIPEILPRYRTTFFNHIVGGYAAGYYVYLWAAVLDSDAFQSFVDSGNLYNHDIAAQFRKFILTEGGNDEGMIQYRKFRGQDPSPIPLLKKRGLDK